MNTYRSFVEFKHVHIDAHPSNDTEIHWMTVAPENTEEQENEDAQLGS